jgi:hypothetical protein
VGHGVSSVALLAIEEHAATRRILEWVNGSIVDRAVACELVAGAVNADVAGP